MLDRSVTGVDSRKKILYLLDQPFNLWNYHRLGIEIWRKNGWQVDVFDLTPLFMPEVWAVHLSRFDIAFLSQRIVFEKSDLEPLLSNGDSYCCCVDYLSIGIRQNALRRKLSKNGVLMISCNLGSLPTPPQADQFYKYIKILKTIIFKPAFMVHQIQSKIAIKTKTKTNIYVVGGNRALKQARAIDSKAQIIKAHNFDYDLALDLKKNEELNYKDSSLAVFLDSDLCNHTDYFYSKTKLPLTPEKYYKTVMNGFRYFERVFKVKVIIAGHPRAAYNNTLFDTGEFPIEYGNTLSLINRSKFVIAHYSTAIQCAVILYKPVVFITTDEISNNKHDDRANFISRLMTLFASELGKTVINLDGNMSGINEKCELQVDEVKYSKYIAEYIKTPGSPEEPIWEIVSKSVEKYVQTI